mmetsp:Transcript_12453/g.31528  ORF Transcript_12453/g.31528 Transcript_12453/m.31528 type:complete len:84 (+) Transcript_12453:169-420(+)
MGDEGEADGIRVALQLIMQAREMYPTKFAWVRSGSRFWIDLLTGSDQVRKGIEAGQTLDQIAAGWQEDLDWWKGMAQNYLLYH